MVTSNITVSDFSKLFVQRAYSRRVKERLVLFIYDLFNDALGTSGYISSDGTMIKRCPATGRGGPRGSR